MSLLGPVKKLSIYVEESAKHHGKPLYEVLLNILYKHGISGATMFRGVAGYGGHGVIHTAKLLELSTSLPLKLEALDTAEKIEAVLPLIQDAVEEGLIEVSDTTVVKCCTKDRA